MIFTGRAIDSNIAGVITYVDFLGCSCGHKLNRSGQLRATPIPEIPCPKCKQTEKGLRHERRG